MKFSVFQTKPDRSLRARLRGEVDGIGGKPRLHAADAQGHRLVDHAVGEQDHASAIAAIHDWFAGQIGGESGFAGVGHRIVHGGSTLSRPVLIDGVVLAALEKQSALAPLDEAANAAHGPRISTSRSRVSAWVIPADENLMIARHTRNMLKEQVPSPSRP